ncbi:MAG: rRNA pseudouridine synthase [Bacteroidetes bacterium]|jgi:23S rRNA pseudouridine2605 synthase|nr:MAG: rRNA pseudouridine synthase [Bacteroidota bacterium]
MSRFNKKGRSDSRGKSSSPRGKGPRKITTKREDSAEGPKPEARMGGKGPKRPTGPRKKFETLKKQGLVKPKTDETRLNKYLATAGIASRREADELISAGLVEVNGKVVQEMGFKVKPGDHVKFNGSTIKGEKKVYYVLNKPKGYITTTNDPKMRKTVMELMNTTGPERIYPVGRLDRQTTGVLLFTNDGDFAKKLTHPSHGARKIYDVSLDKNLKLADFHAIAEGIQLEDGPIKVDEIAFASEKDRKHIGVIIHSGKNRIVRRIFENFGYEVTKLDRTVFAGITKKNLNRGQWRRLSDKEVEMLHML